MPLVPELTDPNDPTAVANWARAVTEALNAGLSFGDPTHPSGTTQFPNGKVDNIRGTFATVSFVATDTATSVAHNLNQPTVGTTTLKPNVMWDVKAWKHNGAGVAAGTEPWSIEFRTGDAIGANSIELRLMAAGARTVGAAPNNVTALLFFQPVTPW